MGSMMSFDEEFARRGTHGLLNLPTCKVMFSSQSHQWASMYVSHQSEAPFRLEPDPVDHHLLVMHLNGPARVTSRIENRSKSRILPPGGLVFWPGGIPFEIELEEQIDTLHIYINAALMSEVSRSMGIHNSDSHHLTPLFASSDPLLEQLSIEALNVAKLGYRGASLYADQIARSLASRLYWISRHGISSIIHQENQKGSLSKAQLRRLEEYVNEHLDEDLRLDCLSSVVGLSVSHFSRRFKASTGKTPHQYVVDRRLERAKTLLAGTKLPIAQVASECGFSHQEHLTHVFRDKVSITPAEFRRQRQE